MTSPSLDTAAAQALFAAPWTKTSLPNVESPDRTLIWQGHAVTRSVFRNDFRHHLPAGSEAKMETLGLAVGELFNTYGIDNYCLDVRYNPLDDNDCGTIEAIFVPPDVYTAHIQPYLDGILDKTESSSSIYVPPSEDKAEIELPECPITGAPMEDPVIDPEGYSYERSAIEAWLQQNPHSPVTRSSLKIKQLVPNRALKELMETLKQQTT
ncbi:MAG: U-box domain-containing protein [Chlamydiia bacterium]|nr:U-box domain-containing protein [Chlamydiia bacterium]